MVWANDHRRQSELPRDWQARRRRVLRRDPICRECGSAPSTDVDHIERGTNHDESNLQGLCHPCHLRKTAREAAAVKRVKYNRRRPEEPHPGLIG